jgi:hypothetical protein
MPEPVIVGGRAAMEHLLAQVDAYEPALWSGPLAEHVWAAHNQALARPAQLRWMLSQIDAFERELLRIAVVARSAGRDDIADGACDHLAEFETERRWLLSRASS